MQKQQNNVPKMSECQLQNGIHLFKLNKEFQGH